MRGRMPGSCLVAFKNLDLSLPIELLDLADHGSEDVATG